MSHRVLLLFSDDSTLFFSLRMRALLEPLDCAVELGWMTDKSALSYRQLSENLPGGPDVLITNAAFKTPKSFEGYDALITSRIFAPLRDMMRRVHVRMSSDRPVVISFQGGLDFTPEKGFQNRAPADAVFIVPASDIEAFREHSEKHHFTWQHVGFGHPSFVRQDPLERAPEKRDVYFFAQAISPISLKARLHIIDMLAILAERDPSRDVYIKLRHLPGENENHLHKEMFDYPSLIEKHRPNAPNNLKLTACTMDEAMENAGLGITCTSTAAVDLVRAGVPTQVYLDYVENYLDPLCEPMRHLFETSNLISTLPEIMDGTTQMPDLDWLANMFCPTSLGQEVLDSIDHVREKAIRVDHVIPVFPDT